MRIPKTCEFQMQLAFVPWNPQSGNGGRRGFDQTKSELAADIPMRNSSAPNTSESCTIYSCFAILVERGGPELRSGWYSFLYVYMRNKLSVDNVA